MIAIAAAYVLAATAARSLTPILTYHDVISVRKADSLWFDCSVGEFKAQIAWFRSKGAKFVSLDAISAARHAGRALPRNAVAITFADNYLGFYLYALPILVRERIPATMFVHTGFVGKRVGRPKMTWEQLAASRNTGLVTVASQTVTHLADLRTMSDSAIEREFAGSRREITRHFGRCDYLAYPNGKFDARVAGFAKRAGYVLAFTERLAPQERAPDDWQIPRYVHTQYRRAWSDAHPRSRLRG